MKILSNYISKTVIGTILLVVLVFLALEVLVEFTREFPDIGSGYYTLARGSLYVLMMLPQDVYQLFPMAGLLGALIGLGILASNRELLVMRAAGVSLQQVAWAVLKAALFLTIIMVVIGEGLAPISQHHAIARKELAMGEGQAVFTRYGIWVRNDGNFLNIASVDAGGVLHSVLRYRFDAGGNLVLASFAESGSLQNGSWIFKNVGESLFNGVHVKTNRYDTQTWQLNLNPRLLGIAYVDTEQKSLPELLQYIQSRLETGVNADYYQLVYWQRLFQPLAIVVMILLAVPFIFSLLRSANMGLRVVVGAVAGFAFFVLNQLAGSLSIVLHLSPLLGAALPMLLFAGFGYVLLLRAR